LRTGTERIHNGYENANGTGTERVQNGYRTDTDRIQNGYRTDTERIRNVYESQKWKKSVLQNANYKRTRFSEHMLVSYAIRVLTKDLETM